MGIMKKVYSYSRVSSLDQTDGFGLSRQKDNADAFAAKFGYVLADAMVDAGVSGFSKAKNNINNGELGKFIELIQAGVIERGSILLIEHLDRIGRHGIAMVQRIIGNIIAGGVEIHVWNAQSGGEPEIYSEETMNELAPAIMLAVHAQSAYKESQKKQERTLSNWEARKAGIADGGILTGHLPKWLHFEGEYIPKKHDTRVIKCSDANKSLIKRIVNMYLEDDLGMLAITKVLKNEDVKPFFKSWSKTSFTRMLKSRSLIGELVLDSGEVYKDYFPKVIDVETFDRIQLKAKGRVKGVNKTGGSSTNSRNLFRGLCVCGQCGKGLSVTTSTGTGAPIDPETGVRRVHYSLRCTDPTCKKQGGWNMNNFEVKFFEIINKLNLDEIFVGAGECKVLQANIDGIKGSLITLEAEIKQAITLSIRFPDKSEIVEKLDELYNSKENANASIVELEGRVLELSNTNTNFDYDVANLTQPQRLAIRAHLKTLIRKIIVVSQPYCHGNKGKGFNVIWKNGKQSMYACELDGTDVINAQVAHDQDMPVYEYNVDTGEVKEMQYVNKV